MSTGLPASSAFWTTSMTRPRNRLQFRRFPPLEGDGVTYPQLVPVAVASTGSDFAAPAWAGVR